VEQGQAILLDFRSKHYYRSLSSKLDKWEMLFKGNASEAYYRMLSESGRNVFRVKGKTQTVLEKIMDELDKQVPEEHTVSALIHTMLACLAEGRANGLSVPVQKALAYIDVHLGEPLQIHDVAEYTGLSRSYFSRLFRSEIGQSPYDYILNVRITTAKDLLTGTTLSVAKVANRCGFVNTSHFVRLFREHTGQTPAAFRDYFNMNLKNEQDIMIEEVEEFGKQGSTDE
jgi:AraC-like DNA-binding protein